MQDLWPESLSATGYIKNKVVLKLVELVVRFIYRHVDLLLVQSQAFIEPVNALASSTPVKYYPNSVDESFFAPSTTDVPAVSGLKESHNRNNDSYLEKKHTRKDFSKKIPNRCRN